MGGGAWDSLRRVGQRDCSVDDDDVKKPRPLLRADLLLQMGPPRRTRPHWALSDV
jgi:hypothetical protein